MTHAMPDGFRPGFYTTRTIYADPVSSAVVTVIDANRPITVRPPVDTKPQSERERCVAILRALIREHNPNDSEEQFATNRMERAISQILSGESS